MASSPSLAGERKRWWLSRRKAVERQLRDARLLFATGEPSDVAVALGITEAALGLAPRAEAAMEMRARCLLALRRFRDVAEMLQDYIPSYAAARAGGDDDSGAASSSSESRERAKLLPSPGGGEGLVRCFSVAELKRRLLAGLKRGGEREGQWRYLALGQACCHLGMMEDALALLQTARRLATAASRRDSVSLSDDSFSPPPADGEPDSAAHLLAHVKLLLRRRAAASAALDAGHPAESARHFSKILDSRRGAVPVPFAAACLVGRASAHRAARRHADAIADCNRALSLDPASIPALRLRADLLQSLRALPDCLRDLDHLKLLYDSILRDGKLPGPPWRPHNIRYRDIASSLRALVHRIQEIRLALAAEGGCGVMDYHQLIGVRRGCTRSEVERAHLLLSLRHKPDRAAGFVDRVEFGDDNCDVDAVRDQAKMSALILYRMLQKGYLNMMAGVREEEEAAAKQRAREAAVATAAAMQVAGKVNLGSKNCGKSSAAAAMVTMIQGVSCREMASVGFGLSIPVKYEALSC